MNLQTFETEVTDQLTGIATTLKESGYDPQSGAHFLLSVQAAQAISRAATQLVISERTQALDEALAITPRKVKYIHPAVASKPSNDYQSATTRR